MRKKLTSDLISEAKRALRYDPETGDIFRLGGSSSAPCTWADRTGYLRVCLMGKSYPAHRIAWALKTGADADGEIDHKNGQRDDNRWPNLRCVSRSQNMQNRRANRGESEFIGVTWNERLGKWRARITAGGKRISLGCYSNEKDASRAYQSAKTKLHDQP